VKTAKELVREIGLAVQPSEGVAIVLTEDPGALPNWVATPRIMEAALTDKFAEKVAELRKTDPNLDWSELDKSHGEARRVVKFSSEKWTESGPVYYRGQFFANAAMAASRVAA
jgi:hypothetical protein